MSSDNAARIPFSKLPKEQQEQILERAKQIGIDPRIIRAATFRVEKDQEKNTFTFTCPYFSFESTYNGPSEDAMDDLFEKYGGIIVGAVITVFGVLAAGVVAGLAVVACSQSK